MERNENTEETINMGAPDPRTEKMSDTVWDERRMARQARRKKNQMIAYSVLGGAFILFLILLISVVHLATSKKNSNDSKKVEATNSQVVQEQAVSGETKQENPIPEDSAENLTTEGETISEENDSSEIVEEASNPYEDERLNQKVDEMIEKMSLEDKVAGLFIVQPEALTNVATVIRAGDNTKNAINQYPVGGIIYFGKNIQSFNQLQEMIDNTKSFSRYPLFVAVDEEGGSVERVADAGLVAKSLSAAEVAEGGDPEYARQVGVTIGSYLNELGFNLDFAPVADLSNVQNSIMGNRTYGDKSDKVIPYVLGMMNGLESQNVTACLKHFPGCGSITDDTHSGVAMSERTKDEFYAEELNVFREGIANGANMIMVGHMSAPYLTLDSIPCSLSDVIITNILREELGYDGVVITDAMNMASITKNYSADEAAVIAIEAGCDMILMPDNFYQAYEGVLKAVQDGELTEERIDESLRRIYRIKLSDGFQ